MKNEAQRIAIAETCGWKVLHWGVVSPQGTEVFRGYEESVNLIPDYPNDLNAMYKAEKVLTVLQRLEYYRALVAGQDRNLDGSHRFGACTYWETLHATAAQRAEAFLKTLNLWTT